MGIIRRQYTIEEKGRIIHALLSGESVLNLGREHNISPTLINHWKRQFLDGELNKAGVDQKVNKLKKEIASSEADDW